LNFSLEYDIRKVQESEKGMELKGKLQFPVYADDVNIQDENTIKKTQELRYRLVGWLIYN
jgi:hypothetical protein